MKTCARISVLAALTWCGLLSAQVPILTSQYDNNRTGANLNETVLTPANVNSSQFGLLFALPVDGNVVAEPLYVPGVTVGGAVHNVLYVATLNNSVFAFDADNPSGSPLWKVSLGAPIASGGIVSTPVIDLGASTIYVVTATNENNTSVFRLHGINIVTGNEPQASSVIQALVPGNGDNSTRTVCGSSTTVQPCVPFVAGEQRQRPALLEANGTIYIAFGTLSANETQVSYHGWLFAYSASTLQQTGVFLTTPTANAALSQGQPFCTNALNPCGHGAGIWMSGGGPAADPNGVYVVTGNGGWGSGNYGESVLRLNPVAQLQDYFTPSNFALLNNQDWDLGDAGPILLPNTSLIVASGKTGIVFVLNRTNLGHMVGGNPQVVQTLQASPVCGAQQQIFNANCYEIHTPAYWARTVGNPVFYVWAWGDVLRAYDLVTNQLVPDSNPTNTTPASNFPGGGLTLSANGNSNGIVWAILSQSQTTGAGSLSAVNASNVTQTLWTSAGIAAEGTWISTAFTAPVVDNGKVYVPTSSNQVRVYGLCSQTTPCYPPTNGPK